jgi:phosphate-selective porin OprO/OprP
MWASLNYLPGLGTVRVGNQKPPISLEHLTSSRFLDFMERSTGFDVYYNRNNGFEPGFFLGNNTEDERVTWAMFAGRTSNGPFGFNQGGGAWDYTGRLTWLPYYEDNGRNMVHLGLGAKYQILDRSTGVGTATFLGRWALRNAQSGLQNVVTFASLQGDDQEMIQPELFINLGPLSMQAEYLASRVTGVTRFNTQLTPTPVAIPSTNFFSQAAYVQVLYFLTGESRPYGKTYLHSSGPAPTRVTPFRNYFWVPGQGGANPFQGGAWQIGVRYSYSDLNSGPIVGGIVHEVTLGLNWFLNPNMKVQWNYAIGHRDLAAGGGTSNGYYDGFGMLVGLDF